MKAQRREKEDSTCSDTEDSIWKDAKMPKIHDEILRLDPATSAASILLLGCYDLRLWRFVSSECFEPSAVERLDNKDKDQREF